jgi:hypothetical protein
MIALPENHSGSHEFVHSGLHHPAKHLSQRTPDRDLSVVVQISFARLLVQHLNRSFTPCVWKDSTFPGSIHHFGQDAYKDT